jgi:hypothetical protein
MKVIAGILAILLIAFCVFMVIGTVRHIGEGLIGGIRHAWYDITDWIAGIFKIRTGFADVYYPMANQNITWNTGRSW